MNTWDGADPEVEALWDAVEAMTGSNPANHLSIDDWHALQNHMHAWRDRQRPYETAVAERYFFERYTNELRRAWAKLYLGEPV